MKAIIAALAVSITLGFSANAQKAGNGGDPKETTSFKNKNGIYIPSWAEVKQDLIAGITAGNHQVLTFPAQLNADLYQEKMLPVLQTVGVEFNDKEIIINGVRKVCHNFIDSETELPKIECNKKDYVSSMEDAVPEDQYKLIHHEYAGLAEIEPNAYGLSDYPITIQISESLDFEKVKKWVVNGVKLSLPKVVILRCEPKTLNNYLFGKTSSLPRYFDFRFDLSFTGKYYWPVAANAPGMDFDNTTPTSDAGLVQKSQLDFDRFIELMDDKTKNIYSFTLKIANVGNLGVLAGELLVYKHRKAIVKRTISDIETFFRNIGSSQKEEFQFSGVPFKVIERSIVECTAVDQMTNRILSNIEIRALRDSETR